MKVVDSLLLSDSIQEKPLQDGRWTDKVKPKLRSWTDQAMKAVDDSDYNPPPSFGLGKIGPAILLLVGMF